MDKVDVKRDWASYRAPRGRFVLVDMPVSRYLMVDGHGDPNTSAEYAAALAALYPAGYRLKFASRTQLGRDYVVPPLEGLWWADDPAAFTTARDKGRWDWTLMLLVPDWVGADLVAQVLADSDDPAGPRVRLGTLAEGRCVQTLHVGPYDAEGPVLARMHEEFMPGQGLRPTGKHHEIYLSDARRVAPDRLRTILRQPVAEV